MNSSLKLGTVPGFVFAWTCLTLAQSAPTPQSGQLLTNAAQVISLPADQAATQIKVVVTGVVTAADPTLKGRFFVQDATSGVFVDNAGGPRPEPGDVVRISGVTDAGAYAPVITGPTVVKLGATALPPAKPVSIGRLMSGAEDSQRVEISGVVRDARAGDSRLIVEMVSGGYRFGVYAPVLPNIDPQSLIGAEVSVRGTAAEAHNRSLRQLVAVQLYVPGASDFRVEKGDPENPFQKPAVPLNSLAQYRTDNSLDRRVHVKGIVTLQRPGEDIFLEDPSGGLQVQSRQLDVFSPGDVVEAVGFSSFENFLPVLQDGVLRKTGKPPLPVEPRPASVAELQRGLHHAEFVSLDCTLVDRAVRQVRIGTNETMRTMTTLILQSSNVVFTAQGDEPLGMAEIPLIPVGSLLEVGGICLTEIDNGGKLKAFRMLIGSPNDIRIIARPSWLTPRHLLTSLAAACVVLVVIAGWSVMVSKKNSVLNYLIREREKAQIELQQAHDQLEQRVKERTAELKFQITARKESELLFKAVLGERTRLAQELHDTVEQTLTGIALQLDTAAKLSGRSPDGTLRHLELARNLMAKSQVEVRRSVWDLRSRALEQFDLPGALLGGARHITDGTTIRVELETKGQPCTLPEIVEENLLRIGQEAVTNVIKHSRATLVQMTLAFEPAGVMLQIEDNGVGFSPENSVGPQDGHFGLLGMSERAKRLGGRLTVNSTPGKGATVLVEIPLNSIHEPPTPAFSDAAHDHERSKENSHPHS